ncbi:hypothetical protein Tco_0589090, partial [Tanacetum coccineum]
MLTSEEMICQIIQCCCTQQRSDKELRALEGKCIPFAFDTFGFLAHEAVKLLSRVQRVMHNMLRLIPPKSRSDVHIATSVQ